MKKQKFDALKTLEQLKDIQQQIKEAVDEASEKSSTDDEVIRSLEKHKMNALDQLDDSLAEIIDMIETRFCEI